MTSTDYENPYRPVPVRIFNRLGTAGQHPEIDSVDLPTVVMVTGLQRTGTTLLQRLLNSLPGVRESVKRNPHGRLDLYPKLAPRVSRRCNRIRIESEAIGALLDR